MNKYAYREICREKVLEYRKQGMTLQECLDKLNEYLIENKLPPNKLTTVRNYIYRPVPNIC